jgi:S-ribosylhomocysteine lyase LuxS involved in autoinducer biosynthesis
MKKYRIWGMKTMVTLASMLSYILRRIIMTEQRTKIPALNDEGKFIYDEHSLLTLDGQRYQCYLDNTHEVFPKTFEEWLRS